LNRASVRSRTVHDDNPSHGAIWGADRHIRAPLLYQLLTGRGQLDTAFGSPLAVRIQGAAILGPLQLTLLTLRCALELRNCHLDDSLDFTKTTGPDLNLSGSLLNGAVVADRFSVALDLDLSRCICHQMIRLVGAHINGQLDAPGYPTLSGT